MVSEVLRQQEHHLRWKRKPSLIKVLYIILTFHASREIIRVPIESGTIFGQEGIKNPFTSHSFSA